MKTKAGLWIDHKAAVIVELGETGEQIRRIPSHVEKQLRRSGDPAVGPFPAREVPRDDSREREYQGQLARYYDAIILQLRAADEILILGPGEAKGELKKRFENGTSGTRMLTLETADKMTEPQIAARIRKHFQRVAPQEGASLTVR